MHIKKKLDQLKSQYNTTTFIKNDPIQFPHQFKDRKDIEVVTFITATITWGKRALILNSATNLLKRMGKHPYDFIMNENYNRIETNNNIHRTFFEEDFIYFCKGLNLIYQHVNTLESVFSKEKDLWDGIVKFRNYFIEANEGIDTKHLSNPNKKSACKRLHMALRWLVRDDGIVDLGIWKNISPSNLYIPLDTHVATISREFGLLKRKSNDRKAVEELTLKLREFDKKDPIGYDFALFGLGEDRFSQQNRNSMG